MVGHSPLVPWTGSVDGAARGFGRRIAGWPALGLRRPGGSRQATVGQPPALPPSAVGSGAPATGLRCLLKEVHEGLWVIVGSHLHQRDVGDRWGCDGVFLPAQQAPDGPPIFILRLDQEPEAIFLLQLHVHERLVLSLMKTRERLDQLRKWCRLGGLHDGVPASSSRDSAPV